MVGGIVSEELIMNDHNYPILLDVVLYLTLIVMFFFHFLVDPWYVTLLNVGVCILFIESVVSVIWVFNVRREAENGGIVAVGGIHP